MSSGHLYVPSTSYGGKGRKGLRARVPVCVREVVTIPGRVARQGLQSSWHSLATPWGQFSPDQRRTQKASVGFRRREVMRVSDME